MVRTRVGYAGGERKNPTYSRLGDHSEAVQIDYDPEKTSYEKLLQVFWQSHFPHSQSRSRQYRNVLFYHDDEQKKIALESRDRIEARSGRKVRTPIEPFRSFHAAEDYHQKYFLQNRPSLLEELRAIYPSFEGFLNSTASARINGYLGGNGTCEQIGKELEDLGLSEDAQKRLQATVCARHDGGQGRCSAR